MKILLFIFIFCLSLNASNISVIKVEGMHCPLCTTAVKKAVNDLAGIEKVSARLNTKEVTVTYSEKVTLNQILEAIKPLLTQVLKYLQLKSDFINYLKLIH